MSAFRPRRFIITAAPVALGLLLHLGLAVDPAAANRSGIFQRSGRGPNTCVQCHGTAGSTLTMSLAPVSPDLPPIELGYVPGAAYTVSVGVSGGPALRFGFNTDANFGIATVTDTVNTRRNANASFPAEMTHTNTGSTLSTWSYRWTAPTDPEVVTFWGCGNSTNSNGSRFGDQPTIPVSFQVSPLPPEVLCRIGNAGDAQSEPTPTLFVNGSRGDDNRRLTVPVQGPMELSLSTFPGAPQQIRYVIWATRHENVAGEDTPLPRNIGNICFGVPPTGAPAITVVNILGHESQLGVPTVPDTPPGPGLILRIPNVPPKVVGLQLTLQGLVIDTLAPAGAAVTNAVVVTFE